MPDASDRTLRTLALARRVASTCADLGIDTVLIGALALAYHGYSRATEDLDLATHVDPFTTLRNLADALRGQGLDVRIGEPDAEDPLGGVLTVESPESDAVQVVNFLNPLSRGPNPGREAIETAGEASAELGLRVVDLAHLVALKLYAGGLKSRSDVAELLERNPGASREAIARVCERHGLATEWAEILADLGE
jgi:nucleotidyltransferase AbiEii toxin of type IV toxin-antitoxin system